MRACGAEAATFLTPLTVFIYLPLMMNPVLNGSIEKMRLGIG